MSLELTPVTMAEANAFVAQHHHTRRRIFRGPLSELQRRRNAEWSARLLRVVAAGPDWRSATVEKDKEKSEC